MTVSFKKTALGAVAALTLGLSVATPASAQIIIVAAVGAAPVPPSRRACSAAWRLAPQRQAPPMAPITAPVRYGGECWMERRPIVDEYGEVIGRRRVRVCN